MLSLHSPEILEAAVNQGHRRMDQEAAEARLAKVELARQKMHSSFSVAASVNALFPEGFAAGPRRPKRAGR